MEPALEAQAGGMPSNEAPPIEKAAVERMGLQQQMRTRRCNLGKTLDRIAGRALHVRKWRVRSDLEVTRQLQWKHEQWLPGEVPHDRLGPRGLTILPKEL